MSSTNKTANLQLSQFLGTDKPAWLGDYNADMQKIDDGYAALKTGEATSTAEIAALQQKDTQIDQSIKDTNDRIDTIATSDIALTNRVTTLEGNYDTMHHEVATNQADITAMKPFASVRADYNPSVDAYFYDIVRATQSFRLSCANAGDTQIFFNQILDANGDVTDSSEIHWNHDTAIHFNLRDNEETIAIDLSTTDKDVLISLLFNKTGGIKMVKNDHGNITEYFTIPIPTVPTTPTT